jgi:hypothetical protein
MADERADERFRVIVLAGERPGGSAFSRQLGLSASVLVDVGGKSALARVIEALEKSSETRGGVLCGPAESVYRQCPEFGSILAGTAFSWVAPQAGPSASALSAAGWLGEFPQLLTAGDHALLTPGLIDDFCVRARRQNADVVFGVVPYARVHSAFPQSRRTVHRFRDGGYCGSNLFALMNPTALAGPRFWQQLEADRKKPWRLVRRIGPTALLRYLLRLSTLEQALKYLSKKIGCRVGCVIINDPRAAVDVDSVADRDLAVAVLHSERSGHESVRPGQAPEPPRKL